MAIDCLPSGNSRARLMIDGQRCTASFATEADARPWEVEARADAVGRHGAASVTFVAYATNWLAGFIDDTPDQARFEAAIEHRLLPVFGQFHLIEVLEADRNQLHRQLRDAVGGGDDGTTRECLNSGAREGWVITMKARSRGARGGARS